MVFRRLQQFFAGRGQQQKSEPSLPEQSAPVGLPQESPPPVGSTTDLSYPFPLAYVRPQARLSASDFGRLTKCQRRLWLDRFGDRTKRSTPLPEALQRAEMGRVHEAAVLRTAVGEARPIHSATWNEAVTATWALMCAGVPGIRQACLQAPISDTVTLRGSIDRLERVEQPSILGSWSYRPIEIKQRREATEAHWLQLDAYQWLVQQVQGTLVPGELWLGMHNEGEHRALPWQRDFSTLQTTLDQVECLLACDDPPPMWFVDECKYCPWHVACHAAAKEQQDIALVPRLDRRSGVALRAAGIATLSQVAVLSVDALQHFPYIGPKNAPDFIAKARALLADETILKKPTPETAPLPSAAIFLDLETDPSTDAPWAFGYATSQADLTIVIVSPWHKPAQLTIEGTTVVLVADATTGWSRVVDAAITAGDAVIHWSSYERRVLAKHAPLFAQRALGPRLVDGLDLLRARATLPLPRAVGHSSESLKTIGNWLGVMWPEGLSDGLATWASFVGWQRSADVGTLARIVAYHRADVIAVMRVYERLRDYEQSVATSHQLSNDQPLGGSATMQE